LLKKENGRLFYCFLGLARKKLAMPMITEKKPTVSNAVPTTSNTINAKAGRGKMI
jgi:hypothetical protein